MNEDKELETLEQKAAAEAAAESIRRIESGLGCYAFGCFPKSFFWNPCIEAKCLDVVGQNLMNLSLRKPEKCPSLLTLRERLQVSTKEERVAESGQWGVGIAEIYDHFYLHLQLQRLITHSLP